MPIRRHHVDISQHPDVISPLPADPAKLTQLTIGDLHGSALKFLYFLVREGAMTLGDKKHYKELYDIYKKTPEDLTAEDLKQFNVLLDAATLNKGCAIRLIGDELCDRGSNDYFTLMIMRRLRTAKGGEQTIPLEVIHSNHSHAFLEAFHDQCLDKPGFRSNLDHPRAREQDRSFKNFIQSNDKGLFRDDKLKPYGLDAIHQVVEDIYKPSLKLISYVVTLPNDIELFTHAPQDLAGIKELASSFGILFRSDTLDTLTKSIDEINKKYTQYLRGSLTAFEERPIQNAIFNFVWRRYQKRLTDPPDPEPVAKLNNINFRFNHGHDGGGNVPAKLASFVTNLDNDLAHGGVSDVAGEYTIYAQDRPTADFQIAPVPQSLPQHFEKLRGDVIHDINAKLRQVIQKLDPNDPMYQAKNDNLVWLADYYVRQIKDCSDYNGLNNVFKVIADDLQAIDKLYHPDKGEFTDVKAGDLFKKFMESHKKVILASNRVKSISGDAQTTLTDACTGYVNDFNSQISKEANKRSFYFKCVNDIYSGVKTNLLGILEKYYFDQFSMATVAKNIDFTQRLKARMDVAYQLVTIAIDMAKIAGLPQAEVHRFQNVFARIRDEYSQTARAITTDEQYGLKLVSFQKEVSGLRNQIKEAEQALKSRPHVIPTLRDDEAPVPPARSVPLPPVPPQKTPATSTLKPQAFAPAVNFFTRIENIKQAFQSVNPEYQFKEVPESRGHEKHFFATLPKVKDSEVRIYKNRFEIDGINLQSFIASLRGFLEEFPKKDYLPAIQADSSTKATWAEAIKIVYPQHVAKITITDLPAKCAPELPELPSISSPTPPSLS